MLVDALRNDFVFGDKSEMHFTRSLLKSGKAMGFTARATAPTVTMPRVKALTTGTVPSFLDAVLNIAESDTSSSLAHYDNILWQLKHQGKKKINLFGDDTWIRLFPGIFSRTDGTSSFFVTDTVEVDTNVTRNVKPELLRNDWGVTIFHYLGLDHIGHLGGPDSPLMGPKQKEMDSVVKTIYDIITKQDMERKSENPDSKSTLFVLLGDHGMNFAGNHGGSSHGETSTTLVFMDKDMDFGPSDKPLSALLDKTLPQVNFASTISLLFGVPIPINNIGYPIMELLDQQSGPERLRSLQLCTHQIYKLLATNDNVKDMLDPSDIKQFDRVDCADISGKDDKIICHYAKSLVNHGKYLSTGSDIYLRQAQASYQETLLITNSYLSESFSNYNFTAMFSGMGLMSLAVLGFLFLRFWEEGWSSEATESTKLFRYFDQSIFWTFIVLYPTYSMLLREPSTA
ncbi:major facilitator super transporter protein [Mycoemilia scoparia]|uniref:GPI ethanolamine phosphate transferase 2 n=1 Tax=Mycoemilia scoparia TaxID=417184 RepID=A0A9W7ZXQ9_9FUNG|nr:major facilitator super transporter protein [Mycoemilia scoparia]